MPVRTPCGHALLYKGVRKFAVAAQQYVCNWIRAACASSWGGCKVPHLRAGALLPPSLRSGAQRQYCWHRSSAVSIDCFFSTGVIGHLVQLAQGKLASDQLPQRGVGALSLPFALSNRAATRSESEMAAAAAERATPSGPGGGAGSPSPGLVQHTFSAIYQEQQQLFFQLVVLQRQIFAWVGTAPPRLASLCLATPTRLVRLPPAGGCKCEALRGAAFAIAATLWSSKWIIHSVGSVAHWSDSWLSSLALHISCRTPSRRPPLCCPGQAPPTKTSPAWRSGLVRSLRSSNPMLCTTWLGTPNTQSPGQEVRPQLHAACLTRFVLCFPAVHIPPSAAKRVRQSVALSVNLPANQPLMRAFAEKRLLQELQALQLVSCAPGCLALKWMVVQCLLRPVAALTACVRCCPGRCRSCIPCSLSAYRHPLFVPCVQVQQTAGMGL